MVRAQVREYSGQGKVWEPTTKTGRTHTVALGAATVSKLKEHRVRMLEERMALGAGALSDDDLVFATSSTRSVTAPALLGN
ncbi:MAG: hypothetical protein ACK5O2_01130 [Microthrixaceae bacterium]